jgi:putative membrane protein
LTSNLFPGQYLEQTGLEPQMGMAIVGFLFGIFLVIGIDQLAAYLKKS